MSNSESNLESRVAPRKRVKNEIVNEQPVFLRKAFTIITNCPSDIGGWSDNGETVVIKNIKDFAEKVIPTAYKHNNFSSFVRQLNFYGFRKVKSESLNNPLWWEFRHPYFVRGKPELMTEIKRSMHFSNNSSSDSSKEITELRNHIQDLNDKIENLNTQVEELTVEISEMKVSPDSVEPKRKLRVVIKEEFPTLKNPDSIPLKRMNSLDSGFLPSDNEEIDNIPVGASFGNLNWMADEPSRDSSQTQNDDELLLFDLMDMDQPVTPTVTPKKVSPLPVATVSAVPASPDSIQSILEVLTPELKKVFVEKLAESLGQQIATTIAPTISLSPQPSKESGVNSSGNEVTAPTFVLPSGSQAPEIALPLASAALGAFIISNLPNLVQPNKFVASAKI